MGNWAMTLFKGALEKVLETCSTAVKSEIFDEDDAILRRDGMPSIYRRSSHEYPSTSFMRIDGRTGKSDQRLFGQIQKHCEILYEERNQDSTWIRRQNLKYQTWTIVPIA